MRCATRNFFLCLTCQPYSLSRPAVHTQVDVEDGDVAAVESGSVVRTIVVKPHKDFESVLQALRDRVVRVAGRVHGCTVISFGPRSTPCSCPVCCTCACVCVHVWCGAAAVPVPGSVEWCTGVCPVQRWGSVPAERKVVHAAAAPVHPAPAAGAGASGTVLRSDAQRA